MTKLKKDFFLRADVVAVARDLIGKVLITNINGMLTGGIIVETEAYSWREKGCHAYRHRRTRRTEVMFSAGGCAYVYLCYGRHHLFNVVTNTEHVPEAVLIRALQPVTGLGLMAARTGRASVDRITAGPGKLTRALGIDHSCNGMSVCGRQVWLEDGGLAVAPDDVMACPRIGVDYAGADASLPWRMVLAHNEWVSK